MMPQSGNRRTTYPDAHIKCVIRELQDAAIKAAKDFPGTNGTLHNGSVCQDDALYAASQLAFETGRVNLAPFGVPVDPLVKRT
jgi:hypothetical protein